MTCFEPILLEQKIIDNEGTFLQNVCEIMLNGLLALH
jgi:hypothetical protein